MYKRQSHRSALVLGMAAEVQLWKLLPSEHPLQLCCATARHRDTPAHQGWLQTQSSIRRLHHHQLHIREGGICFQKPKDLRLKCVHSTTPKAFLALTQLQSQLYLSSKWFALEINSTHFSTAAQDLASKICEGK